MLEVDEWLVRSIALFEIWTYDKTSDEVPFECTVRSYTIRIEIYQPRCGFQPCREFKLRRKIHLSAERSRTASCQGRKIIPNL